MTDGFTTRSWKGREFTVLSLEGNGPGFAEYLAEAFFPAELEDKAQLWSYVNIVGLRMRFSEELIKAMIEFQANVR